MHAALCRAYHADSVYLGGITKYDGREMVKPKQTRTAKATFVECMECLPVTKIPEGPEWSYEIKLDGYRLEAVKNAGETLLYSRRRNILNTKFGYIADALEKLPNGTVIDGEFVAVDPSAARTSICCKTSGRRHRQIHYFVFDVLDRKGQAGDRSDH